MVNQDVMKHSRLRRSTKPMKRSRMKSTPKGTIHANSVWSWVVRARDDHRCQRCGKRDERNNHAHHIAPRSRRPDLKKDVSNGKTVCPPCHQWIHEHPIEAEAAGLLSTESYELGVLSTTTSRITWPICLIGSPSLYAARLMRFSTIRKATHGKGRRKA